MTAAAEKRRIRDLILAFEAAGKVVAGLRLHPDGCVDLLTGDAAPVLSSNDDSDWVSLAGQTKVPGPRGA